MSLDIFDHKYEFDENKLIASGANSKIYRIRDKKSKTEYVLKKLEKIMNLFQERMKKSLKII